MEHLLSNKKPKLIAHRGNISGPNPQNENKYSYIDTALSLGFDVEVDVWVVDNKIFFGHDKPTYNVNKNIIKEINYNGWFHCKNLEALEYFYNNFNEYNYFWHQSDDYVITSQGYIWTFPGKQHGPLSIVLDFDKDAVSRYNNVYGICSDYVL